jgi:hypothetical protein
VYEAAYVEFLNADKNVPVEIHQHLRNVYGDMAVSVRAVKLWVRCVSGGVSGLKDKPRSSCFCSVVMEENVESGVGIGFNTLKTILDILRYRKLCARWVPRMLMLDHKAQRVLAYASHL